MKYKAICSDIDGTLLNSDRDVSLRLKQIIKLVSAHVPLILASSRMPSAMRHLLADLDRSSEPIIAYNGGYVLDRFGNVLDSVVIPLEFVSKILEMTKKTSIHVSLYHGEYWYESQNDYWAQREAKNTKVEPTWKSSEDVLELWSKNQTGAHKVMCMGDSQEISWLFGELHFEHSIDLHLYRSKDTFIEIAAKKISKASALKLVLSKCYDFGMEDVVAFGDNYNDIDLLQSVGWGVAVENARAEVKAVAKEITFHHKEDGVAATLERMKSES